MAVVVAVASAERGCSVFNADLKPPAVQLDLVNPIGPVRRAIDQQARCERDEVRKGFDPSPISAAGASGHDELRDVG